MALIRRSRKKPDPALEAEGIRDVVRKTDANPPMPEFRDDYVLQEVDAEWLSKAVKPKQFLHIDQAECILCEGCVDICPWKCIHMVSPGAIAEAEVGGTDGLRILRALDAWLARQPAAAERRL